MRKSDQIFKEFWKLFLRDRILVSSLLFLSLLLLLQVLGQEPRQTTSNLGHLQKPSVQALIHGLNRHYYSISINYRKNELEQKMLLNLHKKTWMDGLTLAEYSEQSRQNESTVSEMLELAKNYNKVKSMSISIPILLPHWFQKVLPLRKCVAWFWLPHKWSFVDSSYF